jgi:hypothetical protein
MGVKKRKKIVLKTELRNINDCTFMSYLYLIYKGAHTRPDQELNQVMLTKEPHYHYIKKPIIAT